jgi:hypothetical protein
MSEPPVFTLKNGVFGISSQHFFRTISNMGDGLWKRSAIRNSASLPIKRIPLWKPDRKDGLL